MQKLFRAFLRHPSGRIGLTIIALYLLAAILGTLGLTPHDPLKLFAIDRLKPPNATYWFGTDLLGRDTFSRLMVGIKQSMIIDYDAWKEGTPYDLPALSEVTAEERDLLTDEICERSSLDWRDVEALRALATPKAIKRVGKAAEKQTDGAGIEAFMDDIAREGWTPEIETRFIEKLERAMSFTGALDRLYEIAESHPTPAVMTQLMRNARIASDPTVRYSTGGFLLELTGHVDTRYTFDHLELDDSRRGNITTAHYEAGHMMYIHDASLARLRDDLAAFLEGGGEL